MKRDIFYDMILDFLEGNPLKQYEGARITQSKKLTLIT